MSEIKWIKLAADIFDNRKIRVIESLPDGDALLIIWLKLLCLAGTINDNGFIYITPEMPYTEQAITAYLGKPLATVQLAFNIFQQYGMLEIIDDMLHISNWEKYQNTAAMNDIREQTRQRVAAYRERKKLAENNDVTLPLRYSNVTVTEQNKKEDIRKKKEDIQSIITAWNGLNLQKVTVVKPETTRYTLLSARLNEYGVEKILEAIGNIQNSAFLKGQNKTGWVITFDWLIKPNNFLKVLEGNYNEKKQQSGAEGQKKASYDIDRFKQDTLNDDLVYRRAKND